MTQHSHDDAEMQLLSFCLADNLYGIDIKTVQEIRAVGSIRKLPNTPPHCMGIIEFREAMVPLLDLREIFSYAEQEIARQTVVIILSVTVQSESHLVGVLVDSVSDVMTVDTRELKKSPDIGQNLDVSYMLGMFKHQDAIVVVLDMAAVLQAEDMSALKAIADYSG